MVLAIARESSPPSRAALGIPFIFKASYDKANRMSLKGFRGLGIDEGLSILAEVKDSSAWPSSRTSIRRGGAIAAGVVDVVQVPALLSRQTDLLVACGKTGKAVNIKKGQFLSPQDVVHAIRKVESTGNREILVTERGTSFGYHNLVNDFRGLPIMRGFGYPVIFDATHSVQLPGGGRAILLGREGVHLPPGAGRPWPSGSDGIFMEVHEDAGQGPVRRRELGPPRRRPGICSRCSKG